MATCAKAFSNYFSSELLDNYGSSPNECDISRTFPAAAVPSLVTHIESAAAAWDEPPAHSHTEMPLREPKSALWWPLKTITDVEFLILKDDPTRIAVQ